MNFGEDWSPRSWLQKNIRMGISVLSAPNVLAKALAYYRCTFQRSLQLERINQKSIELAIED